MAVTFSQVLLVTAALWVFVAEGNPVHSMKGDLCRRLNGRKYYLEADTQAVITATNVTLPAFPRVATQTGKSSGAYQHSTRRHRREGPQEIGLIETRFRRNITSVTLSSLTSNIMAPKVFVPTPETTRILTPLRTPSLETPPPPPPSPSEPPTTSAPILMDEPEEDMEADTDVSTAISQPAKCGVEIITRPDCHLELSFDKVNLPSCSHDKSCRCDYLRLREPPYRGVGGLDVCSTGDDTPGTFTSQTKEVRLDFLYTRAYEDAFTVSIIAKRNKYRVMGKVNNTIGYIRSPFFPELYPREHWMEYELVSKDENALVVVTFLDFQLSPWSFVEVQDTNKTRVAVFNGNLFRPPVLVSSGPHITVRFSGNGETARGFNMQYAFIDAASNAVIPPITDCGGYVTNFGGTITMMNMSKDERNFTMYDCVWIVQPPQNYAFKSHLSIKVVQFEEMASATTLEIRQGVTSDDYLLERIEGGDAKTSQEHVVAVDTGFYVRLRGFFNKSSKLAIVYTSFSYLGSCYSMTDLMCHNHRCIPKMLRCDGFDHCGDNSDEPPTCYVGAGSKGLTPEDAAWWYQHTPNYYFPQKSSLFGGPHGWSGVLLLTSLIVMVLLIIGLISYLFRHGPDRRHMRDRRHNGIHSRRGSITDDVEVIDASADDPPLYEPPPDYEEVIKVILSGNNLKLVRRPGGVTAWVPDKLAEEGNDRSQPSNDRPLRTRHASLDLEQGMEVVLWNSNSSVIPSRNINNTATASNENESSTVNIPNVPFRMGHVRRSSLPTAPTPEAMQTNVQGHSVSVAPETIPEAPEALESPRPPIRHIHTLSSPQISLRSFNYDTSAVSTPGPSTPHLSRTSPKRRKSKKVSRKGGKRKKSSASRKPEQQNVRDDSAPPSYEDAMQQVIQSEVRSATPATETHSGIEATNHVNESTQTSIDAGMQPDTEDLSPTDRVQAAREMFQRLSKGDRKPAQESAEVNGSQHIAKRPAVQVNKTKHQKSTSSGGTITRGTVKARKAMLLKAQKQRRDCDCNGACSCAHFKPDSPSEETPFTGGVKSKVKYYLTIEESTKNGEHNLSTVPSPCENEPQESQQKLEIPEASNAAHKRRKLVRNQSAPTIGRIRDRDLEIYFSQTEETQGMTMPSPTEEDMERPLITPVTDSPKPIFIVPKNTANKEEMTDHVATTSIQNRVKLYNDLAKSESPSPLPPQTPSPLRSPVQGIKLSKILRNDSIESLDGGNNTGIMCMKSMKASACEAHIKPGIVKEATAKFITTLTTDIRPKLHHQDSDDWNGECDSPLPVRIPYLNLRNEASSSPDICDSDNNLFLPPLKREEAESIELWDSISQGRSEEQENFENFIREDITEQFPAPSSGAVPKKSVGEVTINLSKEKNQKLQNENAAQTVQHQTALENDMELKSALKLNLTDTFSPASDAEMTDSETPDQKQDLSHQSKQMVLEEVNLSPKNLCYQSSSDDDSLPPTPHNRRNLDETLNETLDSDTDVDGFPRTTSSPRAVLASGCSTVSPKHTQEVKALRKFPVPSPRGSKAAQPKLSRNVESSLNTTQPSSEGHLNEEKTTQASSPVLVCSTSSSLSGSPEASSPNPSTPRSLMTPTLSPQMESSGIVTINTSKRLRWDYI